MTHQTRRKMVALSKPERFHRLLGPQRCSALPDHCDGITGSQWAPDAEEARLVAGLSCIFPLLFHTQFAVAVAKSAFLFTRSPGSNLRV